MQSAGAASVCVCVCVACMCEIHGLLFLLEVTWDASLHPPSPIFIFSTDTPFTSHRRALVSFVHSTVARLLSSFWGSCITPPLFCVRTRASPLCPHRARVCTVCILHDQKCFKYKPHLVLFVVLAPMLDRRVLPAFADSMCGSIPGSGQARGERSQSPSSGLFF